LPWLQGSCPERVQHPAPSALPVLRALGTIYRVVGRTRRRPSRNPAGGSAGCCAFLATAAAGSAPKRGWHGQGRGATTASRRGGHLLRPGRDRARRGGRRECRRDPETIPRKSLSVVPVGNGTKPISEDRQGSVRLATRTI